MDISRLLGLPVVATFHGQKIDDLIIYVHWLMFVLFVGWSAFFLYALFRFRASKNSKADYVGVRNHAATWVEVAVAIVEGVLLFGFAVPLWAKVVEKPPTVGKGTGTIELKISAHQFNWTARFPGKDGIFGKQNIDLVKSDNPFGVDSKDPNSKDDFTAEGEFSLPVNHDVLLHLTSQDVIHCFKVLPFRVTQDAIPGESIALWFKPTVIGNYRINCAQLCGNGHYSMRGILHIVSDADYEAWAKKQSENAAKGGGGGFE